MWSNERFSIITTTTWSRPDFFGAGRAVPSSSARRPRGWADNAAAAAVPRKPRRVSRSSQTSSIALSMVQTMATARRQDLLGKLAGLSEDAIQRLAEVPGADRAVNAINTLRDRTDE